jgi:arylsulfatase A-like enzyme
MKQKRRNNKIIVSIAAVIVLIACFIAYRPAIRNVIIISMDTTRADLLGCYMCRLGTTPNVDKLAAEGILFEDATTPMPYTLPAHCSMLTGTSPLYHNVLDNSFYQLSDDNVTLAERLKKEGFTTAAFVSSFVLDPFFGLNQGFDEYDADFKEQQKPAGPDELVNERKGWATTVLAMKWLENHRNKKNFLFIHYFDPHYPYEAPEPFASKFQVLGVPKLYCDYAGEVGYVDYCIGRVIQKLKELGLYDSALIVVTADHGESLEEHKEQSHGYFIYQSTMHVPLVFKIPGGPPPGGGYESKGKSRPGGHHTDYMFGSWG